MLPVTLRIHRPRSIDAALTLAHVLTGLALTPAILPMPLKLVVWVVLAISLFRLLLRRGLPTALKLDAAGRLFLLAEDGAATEYQIDPATSVMPWLVVLRLKTGRTSDSLVLPVDAIGAEGHRQLRAWLRWRAKTDPA
jgi:hypothetical protein